MDRDDAKKRLETVEKALDEGQYRRGQWQAFLRDASVLDAASRGALADDVSRVSRKLHARNHFVSLPFSVGLLVEIVLFVLSVMALATQSLWLHLVGVVLLVLCLQPLIKVITGLLVGVRYDYAYLWYIEPRFKMRYGSYFRLDRPARVLLHLSGAVGTPVATLVGFLVFLPGPVLLAWLFGLLFVGALILQVGAFAAEWFGIRMVGPFRLANLTSPATAAMELRERA